MTDCSTQLLLENRSTDSSAAQRLRSTGHSVRYPDWRPSVRITDAMAISQPLSERRAGPGAKAGAGAPACWNREGLGDLLGLQLATDYTNCSEETCTKQHQA